MSLAKDLRLKSSRIEGGPPNPMASVLTRRAEDTETGGRPWDSKGRDWRERATSQGTNARGHQKPEGTRKGPPLEPSGRTRPCCRRHLDLGLPAARIREYISAVVSYQVLGNSLQQPQEIHLLAVPGLCHRTPRPHIWGSLSGQRAFHAPSL